MSGRFNDQLSTSTYLVGNSSIHHSSSISPSYFLLFLFSSIFSEISKRKKQQKISQKKKTKKQKKGENLNWPHTKQHNTNRTQPFIVNPSFRFLLFLPIRLHHRRVLILPKIPTVLAGPIKQTNQPKKKTSFFSIHLRMSRP